MKVTIITTCYNRVATIRDAIESVLAQDYPQLEYILSKIYLIRVNFSRE